MVTEVNRGWGAEPAPKLHNFDINGTERILPQIQMGREHNRVNREVESQTTEVVREAAVETIFFCASPVIKSGLNQSFVYWLMTYRSNIIILTEKTTYFR